MQQREEESPDIGNGRDDILGESPGKVGIVTPERSNLEFDEQQKGDLDL